MKLQFKIQQYQTDAVESVVKVFAGQPNNGLLTYKVDQGKVYVVTGGKKIEVKDLKTLCLMTSICSKISTSCRLKTTYIFPMN